MTNGYTTKTIDMIPIEMIEEFKTARQIDSKRIIFSKTDSKSDKVAIAFPNSFDKFFQAAVSFFEQQREVNKILVSNHLKKTK